MLPLPWEIIFMILEHLPPHSSVALALTIKPLFTTLFPTGRVPVLGYHTGRIPPNTSTHFELSERDELLLLLEKDDPTVAFCFDCRKLCAINSGRGHLSCAQSIVDESVVFFGDEDPATLGITSHPLAWVPRIGWPAVNFAEAHLAVNRHMYGQAYGLPLGPLEYSYEFERFIDLMFGFHNPHFPLSQHPQGRQYLTRHRESIVRNTSALDSDVFTQPWAFKHISEAKVIDNELYIARFHSIKGPPLELFLFSRLMSDLDLPICKHKDFHIPSSLPNLWWSCGRCFTDFSVSVYKDDLTGWHCEVATCHRLGSCRSPSDSIWRLANDIGPQKWRLERPPDESRRINQLLRILSHKKENLWDQDLELVQKAERNRLDGIEGCWAHLRERLPDWKRWEVRELDRNDAEEDRTSRNSTRSLWNLLRLRRSFNTGNN